MRHSTLGQTVSACMVTVFIAAAGPAAAYTITVDPLPALTFPKKAAGSPACTPPCPPKPVAR